MNSFVAYIESPIGILEIKGNVTLVNSVLFVNNKGLESDDLPFNILECKRQLREYFDGSRRIFTINAEQKGSPFQQIVWRQLREIPYGKKISYLQIAKQIANEKIVRALGNANGKNKIFILIPCHRVVGTDGSLVGYAGELWRKDWLLKHEARFAFGMNSLFD